MKVPAGIVLAAYEILTRLIKDKEPMPTMGRMGVSLMLSEIAPKAQVVAEQRDALIEKYGESKEGQVSITLAMAGWGAWVKEWTEVAAKDLEVAVEPIKISLLDSGYVDRGIRIDEIGTLLAGGLITKE